MPRIARPVFAGLPHHVTQRGNRREDVFFCDADRAYYLKWLAEYCRRHHCEVRAYCLMPNHIHAVVVPSTPEALEQVFRPLHTRYALRMNRLKGWTGHLWQGRYFSAALDEPYFWATVRYVERNPVRAGLVRKAEDYRWSSAGAHCGLRSDRVLSGDQSWMAELDTCGGWADWLAIEDDRARLKVLRHNVERSVPCGSDDFIARLESVAGKPLRTRPCGRPAGWRKPK